MRTFINWVTYWVAWFRKGRTVVVREHPVKINLGSGLTVARGWINLDGSLNAFLAGWPRLVLKYAYQWSDCRQWYSRDEYVRILTSHVFVHHRMEYGLPFSDGTVEYAFSSHMLEHCFRDDAERLLREVVRVLRPGGRFRLAIPDLEIALGLYHNGEKARALEYFFSPTRGGALNRHHYMYDFELIRNLLEKAGFVEVSRCSYRCGQVPDIDVLDNRPEETLFVEAVKPGLLKVGPRML
jgi:predicted SAM-dependent methyltransferase